MQNSKSFLESEITLKTSRPQFRILPNIGNTCFLSSTVQALYQIPEIRQSMEEYNGSQENILYFLRILFQQMSKQTPRKQKRNTLKNIQTILENCLIDYVRDHQYDAFQTFLAVFDMILQQFPQLSQLFQIEYQLSCNCDKQPRILSQLKIDAQEGFCAICKRQFQTKLLKVPAYLIVFERYSKQVNKVLKDLEAKEVDKIAKVIYRGNKRNGHYYALCREDKFYSFDDNSYSQVTNTYYNSQQCLFSIYGKVQLIPERPIRYDDIMHEFLEKVFFIISVSILAPIALPFIIEKIGPKIVSLVKKVKEELLDKVIEAPRSIIKKIGL